jgi:CBS-domain-containing membrane protein
LPVIDYRESSERLDGAGSHAPPVIQLPVSASLEQPIRYIIKYKVNALKITAANKEGLGVVSKTDLMGAYYAGLTPQPRLRDGNVGAALVLPSSGDPGLRSGRHADQPGSPPLVRKKGGTHQAMGSWVIRIS